MAKHNPSPNKPHTGISKRLKKCTKCNKVWEIAYQTKNIIYYEDFPTYKLLRKDCAKCMV